MKNSLKAFAASISKSFLNRNRPIWQGIYSQWEDVPTEGSDYSEPQRVAETANYTRRLLDAVKLGEKPDFIWHQALGAIASSVLSERKSVTLLDYGGGAGVGYIYLQSTLPSKAAIQYHVVELAATCAAGRALFPTDSGISFSSTIPTDKGPFDIIYLSSVLSYIQDYAGLLNGLMALRPKFIIITRQAAGSFPTYAAQQVNLPGQKIACWFFNADELVGLMATQGYTNIYAGVVGAEYDQSNYPRTHRMTRMKCFIFSRP